jgi:hypothetical protein
VDEIDGGDEGAGVGDGETATSDAGGAARPQPAIATAMIMADAAHRSVPIDGRTSPHRFPTTKV